MFRQLQAATLKISTKTDIPKFNSIFWFIDKENDMPPWFSLDNPKIKSLPIPKPDYIVRKIIVENLSNKITGTNS